MTSTAKPHVPTGSFDTDNRSITSISAFENALKQFDQAAAVLKLTRSLGRRLAEEPETFAWMDDAGDEVEVELRQGRVTAWRLRRAGGGGA